MNSKFLAEHRSWFYSGGIAVLIVVWLVSGSFGDDEIPVDDAKANAAG